ncbi:hypothetical protein E8E13_004894 [Curvularia kusanoi]|uniref:Uncharacterized protein n=1 Tax=Curvularia kusanoi TaxID=90978 RepID=A0A9P4WCF9_CURKU|nr:hypothetical protein E8E13_004894 [Curvularia kusanoi]
MLCRVIEQAYGYVNPAVQEDFDKEQARTAVIKASEFTLAGNTIMNERYDGGSFIREWVEGEVYAEHYATLITNWDLEARAIELFPPENATPDQLRERQRQLARLDADTGEVQIRVMAEYQNIYRLAVDKLVGRANADTCEKLARVQNWYSSLRTERIVSRIPGDRVFTGQEEVQAAKLMPLYSRDESDRHSFWRERLNNDVIVSHIGYGCKIVDVRAMLAEPRFNDMINWRLVRVCDQIHRRIITPQNTELCSNLDIEDSDQSEDSLRSAVNGAIRDLDTVWRRSEDDVPEWGDVPVFNTLQSSPYTGFA